MNVITSKLTSKAQTTIPRSVRHALRIEAGDELVYRIEEDRVIVTKAHRRERAGEDPFRAFSEWTSQADEEAYGDL